MSHCATCLILGLKPEGPSILSSGPPTRSRGLPGARERVVRCRAFNLVANKVCSAIRWYRVLSDFERGTQPAVVTDGRLPSPRAG